jgi:hypothetical protein
MRITSSSTGKEIAPIALAVHELVNRLPTTMRTKNSKGVRIEGGKIIDYHYTGPVLERVLDNGKICRGIPKTGPYTGTPVVVVPVIDEGEIIATIGIVDITKGIFSDLVQIARRPELITPEMPKGEFY